MEFDRDELNKKLLQDFYEEIEQEEAEEKESSAAFKSVKILVSMILFSAVVFTSYAIYTDKIAISKNTNGEVPLVMADKSAVRFKPKDPGGMQIPNRDKSVYNAISGEKELPKVVRIRPLAEEPINREIIRRGEVNVAQLLDEMEEHMPKTLPELVEEKGAKKTNEKEAEKPLQIAEIEETKLIAKQELMSKDVEVIEEKIAATTSNIKIIPVPRGEGKPLVVSKKDESGFRLQLGSYRSEEDVKSSWNSIKNKHSSVLSDAKLQMEKADLGSKGVFYRLQVSGFKSESDIRKACQKLIEKKQGCFVVKN